MSGEEVLLVDDDPIYRRNIKHLLVRDGKSYRFVEAESPSEGIEKLTANPQTRVILLDLDYKGAATAGQPSLDDKGAAARRLLDHIAGRPSYYRVIILTAHDALLSAEEAEKAGVFTYLPKADKGGFPIQALRFSVDQAFKDLERVELAKKIRFMQDVQKRINENQPLEDTLNMICRAVLATVEGYTCHIRMVDVNRGDYRIAGFAGPSEHLKAMFDRPKAKGEFFSGRVVGSGKSEFFSDLQHLPEFGLFAAEAMVGSDHSEEEDLYWRTVSSAFIVPIKTGLFGDAVDAVLNVSSQLANFFVKDETRELVEEFATQAELALTKYWLNLKRHKIHQDYKRIGGMLDQMIGCLDVPDPLNSIYQIVTETVDKLVHPEVITIFRFDNWTQRVESVYQLVGSKRQDNTESYGLGQSLTGTVFKEKSTIHLPDPDDPASPKPVKDPRFQRENPQGFLTHAPSGLLEHYLAVPIRIGEEFQGVLRITNRKSKDYKEGRPQILERGFGTDCRFLMEITARLLAVAIRLAELVRDTRQRLELVQTVGAASRLINSAHSVEELLTVTAEKMADVMQAQVSMLFIKPEGENRVVLKGAWGMDRITASYDLGEGETGRVALQKKHVLIPRAPANDGKYDLEIRKDLPDRETRPGVIESLMIVPIVAKGTMIGVMKVVNRRGDLPPYTEDDLQLLQSFADYFAVAFENASLFDRTNAEMIVHKRNEALSTLISAVAHEIRNTSGLIPANIAGLRVQLGAAPEAVSRRLNLIERVAAQATDFASELAGFALSKRGEKQLLDINDVVRRTLADLKKVFGNANGERICLEPPRLSETPLYCWIYENPFVQMIRNIVINALQALEGSEDGRIVVSTLAQGPEAVIVIDDNGPGIPTDYESKIFEPEFSTKPNGNGIGLWLVRTQFEQIGGRIEVQQKKEEKGARFAMTVPRENQSGDQQDAANFESPAR